MKKLSVFVDVDLTIIDEKGNAIDGAIEGLYLLKNAGCSLYLWSAGGEDYAKEIAKRLDIVQLFDAIISKPDIVIDDMPSSTVSPFVYRVSDESSWRLLLERILRRHFNNHRE